jgi:hypothetical protein
MNFYGKGKRLLGRPRRIWIENNKMRFGEVGWCGMDWTVLAAVGENGGIL